MIDDFGSYDMDDIKSPLDRLPSIIRRPSFFGDAPSFFPSTRTDGKGKPAAAERGDESPRRRKDSVMTGVYGSASGSASVSVSSVASCKRPAVTVRKRVLGVDEKGESSRSAEQILGLWDGGSEDDRHIAKGHNGDGGGTKDRARHPRPAPRGDNVTAPGPGPGPVAPRRSRFVEDLEGVRTETVGRTPAEVCHQICLPDQARTATKGADPAELHFPPAAVPPLKKPPSALGEGDPPPSPPPSLTPPATPSSGWSCHHDGACLRTKVRHRRSFVRAVVRLAKKPTRWWGEDKGKRRAACEVCGDDAPLNLRDWGRDGDAPEPEGGGCGGSGAADEVAGVLSMLSDRDEAEGSRRCSGCGQRVGEEVVWERDEDAQKDSGGTTLGPNNEAAKTISKAAAAAGLTETPEAWWTRRYRL